MNRTLCIALGASATTLFVIGALYLSATDQDAGEQEVPEPRSSAPETLSADVVQVATSTTQTSLEVEQPTLVPSLVTENALSINPPSQETIATTTPTQTATPRPLVDGAPATQVMSPVTAFMLKDVGEAYLYHFGLTSADFKDISSRGFTIIQGNFDICASEEDVQFFLDSAHAHGLRVVLPAGSGEAEWGFPCDEDPQKSHKPTWERALVQEWVGAWKDHPALYAWDTSNEAGGNFPFANEEGWETSRALTVPDLQTAYRDVRAVDPNHPILIRMNGWYFYDYDENFFRPGNPFGPRVADIVMVNTYSNVDEYFDDFVATVTMRAQRAIRKFSPETELVIALGAWKEPPLWSLPELRHVRTEVDTAAMFKPQAVAFFKYGAKESDWYLPRDFPTFWKQSQDLTTTE